MKASACRRWLMRDAFMFLLCSVCAFQTARSQVPTAPGIIPRLVADAQASAKTRVSVGMTRVTFAVNKSLNQSLISQVPLMVLIEGRAASVSLMGDNIWTWYRAKVVNNPGGIQIPQMAIPPFSLEVVPPTLTLSADEILIRNPGGDLVINGVTVTSKEYPRTLEIGKHYLLFLRFNN